MYPLGGPLPPKKFGGKFFSQPLRVRGRGPKFFWLLLLCHQQGCKVLWSVCLSANLALKEIIKLHLIFAPVACVSHLLVLVLWIMTYLSIVGEAVAMRIGFVPIVTHQGLNRLSNLLPPDEYKPYSHIQCTHCLPLRHCSGQMEHHCEGW